MLKKDLLGLTVSEGLSMTIMIERMTVGSHGTEEEAGSLHVETTTMVMFWVFETSEPITSGTPPSTKPHLLILTKQRVNIDTDIKYYLSPR